MALTESNLDRIISAMNEDKFEYNNEEEAEMAQLNSIHAALNAADQVRAKLAEQSRFESLEHCADCGDDIPKQRQLAIKGCSLCVHCQELFERSQRGL